MVKSLLGLIGGVALLFWGVYMVKTGMLRTFGVALQKGLARALHNRVNGFAAGFGLSTLLQSSTAAGLLVAGLQAENVVTTAIAISTILGAELGSAFVACVLSFNFEAFAPLFIAAGVIIFFAKKTANPTRSIRPDPLGDWLYHGRHRPDCGGYRAFEDRPGRFTLF